MELPNYSTEETLHDGPKTVVYRAIRQAGGLPVILKALKQEYPTAEDVARLRREYEITRELRLDGVVASIELLQHGNGVVLVREDFHGHSLREQLREGRLDLDTFFAIAVQLASTLGHLHQLNIVHMDVNPANIIINPQTKQVKLTDFGLATLLAKEGLPQMSRLKGTLDYISPEQTGRMNRSVDHRTDFYALGVTLYEMVTGQLPFRTNDPVELIHSHIARTPTAPAQVDRQIPPVLSRIIMKLLEKTAEQRYQSGFGLLADLQRCQRDWQANRRIDDFAIAESDFSERFHIPEKLYGREQEIDSLLAIFARVMKGNREIVVISGDPGIGKSVLVQEVRKSLALERGYFVSGKFDQFQRNIPYASLIQAFQDLVRQLLTESETHLNYWRERIRSAVGVNGSVLVEVIPEIELITGEQPPVQSLPPAEAQNRFKMVFQNFVAALPAKEHPLVIFLDDLQWADAASLQLLQFLIIETSSPYFLGIGAYRDNETGPAHPLMLALEAIESGGVTLHRLAIKPLQLTHISQLICDTLRCRATDAQPLAKLVLQKTEGNPFFVNQFLHALNDEKLLSADAARRRWRWNLPQIHKRGITDNVVDLMTAKLRRLRDETRQVLRLAACIGNQFDLQTLAIVYERPAATTAADLSQALQEGLVIPGSDFAFHVADAPGETTHGDAQRALFRFVHDRVQQAAYLLLSDDDKKSVHWQIGRLLLQNIPEAQRERRIFDIVNQLNAGLELAATEAERIELAQLNLAAGHKAKQSSAYAPAFAYLQTGLDLLRDGDWQANYELTLGLHVEGAEAAYLSGHAAEMEKLVELVLQHATSLLDKVKVYEVKLEAYFASARLKEMISTALPVLRPLGLNYPDKPGKHHVVFDLIATKLALAGKKIEKLGDLPEMTDPHKLAAIRISSRVGNASYYVSPDLFALTVFKPLRMFLQHGNAPIATSFYSAYGIILCGVLGDIERGYRFGKLGLDLAEAWDVVEFKSRIMFIYNALIRHWKEPLRDSLEAFLEAYQCGLDAGDLEYAGYSILHHLFHSFLCGVELEELNSRREKYDHALDPLKQETFLHVKRIMQQVILNLMGKAENPTLLRGEIYDEVQALPIHIEANDRYPLYDLYLLRLFLHYWFEEHEAALEDVSKAETYLDPIGAYAATQLIFYESLVRLALCSGASRAQRRRHLRKVKRNQRKMKKWVKHAPMNHQHKFELVEAERHRVAGQYSRAMECYERAIAGARKNQFLHEEAMANELAARFYLSRDQVKLARPFLHEAHYLYERWGAHALANKLETMYPELLQERTLAAQAADAGGLPRRTSVSTTGSTTTTSGAFDVLSVLKATQAISSEIELERLLQKMIHIVIENAGARKGCLLLEQDGEWFIEAEGRAEGGEAHVLASIPLPAQPEAGAARTISPAIVHYVSRTRETVVLAEAAKAGQFANDPFIRAYQAKSVLCKPLINQGKLVGILYLENDLAGNAFVADRLEALEILASQIAVSLENARLYHETRRLNQSLEQAAHDLEEYNRTLEDKVGQRTNELQQKNRELEQTLRSLKATQEQLIVQEKMASLGQLTAGIAHEIRNPLNFVNNFATLSMKVLQELGGLVEKQKERIEAGDAAEIEEEIGRLRELNKKINEHGKRAGNIVSSMMEHARSGKGERTATDINLLLDESANLVYHGMRAKHADFNVTLRKEYDTGVGRIAAVSQDLSRVFLNIIGNACYAAYKKARAAGNGHEPTIWLKTSNNGDTVEIRIRDNGDGIPAAIREKIFLPFFTTKPSGEGTGLGLSISYDTIVKVHGGELRVESKEGEFAEFIIVLPRQELGA